jgi:hypothetical protein
VCDGSTCKKVDLALPLPLQAEGESGADLKGLIPVR